MARFTTYFDSFKYTFVTSFFPHPKNYAGVYGQAWGYDWWGQGRVFDGLSMFMAHRLEWRIFRDKVNVALTEGVMYMSETNALDLQVLNPVMIYHDYYIRANANSILSLEMDYTPVRNFNIYGQFVMDEFAIPGGEAAPGISPWSKPNGMGYMLGFRGAGSVGKGLFYGSLEGP